MAIHTVHTGIHGDIVPGCIVHGDTAHGDTIGITTHGTGIHGAITSAGMIRGITGDGTAHGTLEVGTTRGITAVGTTHGIIATIMAGTTLYTITMDGMIRITISPDMGIYLQDLTVAKTDSTVSGQIQTAAESVHKAHLVQGKAPLLYAEASEQAAA